MTNPDTPPTVPPHPDTPTNETPRTYAAQNDTTRTAATESDALENPAPKNDAPKTPATRADATESDATRADVPKNDETKNDAAKTDATAALPPVPPVELDLLGLNCPLPVLRARKALSAMPPGTRLHILASDPMSAIDIPHMCNEDGHRLVSADVVEGRLEFVIERG